ncbi:MAG: enoyl-CoA hydratase/isomerase family protein [Actinobacteria bacterium]|nr:enoyl-CoA hydratase/isomerase family protein [Actinomycetota bacterium]
MSFATLERRDGGIAVVTLNRPEALNAISGAVADDLRDAFRAVVREAQARVVVLEAAGEKAFSVGADLKERSGKDFDWLGQREHIRDMFTALRAVPQPTIASVFGFALGGGFELALSCDLIVASEDARMGLTEVRVGIIPGGGGTQMLTRKVGLSRAKEMIFTGRHIDAREALELGLVAQVTPRDALSDVTLELARRILASAPRAVREAKAAIDQGFGLPIEEGIGVEDLAWRRAVDTKDRAEGIAAFVEKRAPHWYGE